MWFNRCEIRPEAASLGFAAIDGTWYCSEVLASTVLLCVICSFNFLALGNSRKFSTGLNAVPTIAVFMFPVGGRVGAAADPSCHWARGWEKPGQSIKRPTSMLPIGCFKSPIKLQTQNPLMKPMQALVRWAQNLTWLKAASCSSTANMQHC